MIFFIKNYRVEKCRTTSQRFRFRREQCIKNLEVIKNNIKNFENISRNKFRKVVETETNKILDELSCIKVSKILNLKGIYDYSVQDEIM